MSRHLALGGIVGPLLFAATVIIVGFLRPDYDHTRQFISELGEAGGEFSSLMNYLGFMCSAAFIMLFTVALRYRFSPTILTRSASLLVGVFASGMFLAGVFSCDATCTPVEPSTEQLLHNLVSFAAFLALMSSAFLWGVVFRRDSAWHRFGTYSQVTAGLSVILLIAMVASAWTRTGSGALQRCFLATLFLWMSLFALRIWREDLPTGAS